MSDAEIEQVPGSGLHSRLWKTKGSRFVARERLRKTNTFSITTVTMLSVYVIVSSVVLLAFSDQLNDLNEKWLNVVNVALSVLIIAFSLIEASRDHLGAAETMNQSGLRVGEIYGALSAKMESRTLTSIELEEMEQEYAAALRESKLNHSSQDYLMFQIKNWREFDSGWLSSSWARFVASIYIIMSNYFIYIIALIVFPILALIYGKQFLSVG